MIRPKNLIFPVISILVVFGSLLGIVVIQTFIVQNRVQLDSISVELSEERALNQALRLDVIELEAPERILETASSRLGMIRPTARTYLPGVDPDLQAIVQPPRRGDPFGPAPLSAELVERFNTTLRPPTADFLIIHVPEPEPELRPGIRQGNNNNQRNNNNQQGNNAQQPNNAQQANNAQQGNNQGNNNAQGNGAQAAAPNAQGSP